MQAESVSPATSVGLKLLDLAKALHTDGELALYKPVEDSTTNKKVENTENRLNEFADMLNYIAESVGVALDTSSSTSPSSSISGEEEDEDGSTAATVMEVASGLSFSTTVSLLETPAVPLFKPDLGKLVEEAEKLEKEEVDHDHTPVFAESQDMGGAKIPKSTSQIRAHAVPTNEKTINRPETNTFRFRIVNYSQVPAPTGFHQAPGQGGMMPHSSVYPAHHPQYMYDSWQNGSSNNGSMSGKSSVLGAGIASQHGGGAGAGAGAGFGFAQYSQVNPYAGLGN
ncbi:hypothetical protein V865_002983 [Kwoniella europaea PYCC6329]|uniref:Uncharacterized protein n=1 Tax=Kwoniella europaea PYCC6329 TaxID=1423913 RepID=A0AAX4KGW4_9TREE